MEARLLAQAQLSKQPPTQRKSRKPALAQLQILQKLWTLQTRFQRQVLGCLKKSSKKWGSWQKGNIMQHAGHSVSRMWSAQPIQSSTYSMHDRLCYCVAHSGRCNPHSRPV